MLLGFILFSSGKALREETHDHIQFCNQETRKDDASSLTNDKRSITKNQTRSAVLFAGNILQKSNYPESWERWRVNVVERREAVQGKSVMNVNGENVRN